MNENENEGLLYELMEEEGGELIYDYDNVNEISEEEYEHLTELGYLVNHQGRPLTFEPEKMKIIIKNTLKRLNEEEKLNEKVLNKED